MARCARVLLAALIAAGAGLVSATAAHADYVGSPTVIATITGLSAPEGVAITPDGSRGYVTNSGSNSVSVFSTATNTIIGSPISVGVNPSAVAVTPNGQYAYVTNENVAGGAGTGTVSVIDTATSTAALAFTVGTRPTDVAITPDGTRAFVTNFGQMDVRAINTATNTVLPGGSLVGTEPLSVAITPNGSFAYVTAGFDNQVAIVNTAAPQSNPPVVAVASRPYGVAVNPAGTRVYVSQLNANSVSIIDTATNLVIGSAIPVGANPAGVAITPDGRYLYVANYSSNSVSVIDTTSNAVTATVGVGSNPVRIAISPDGTRAYVTNYGSDSVSVIDTGYQIPVPGFSATTPTFPQTAIGQTSAAQTVTVTNTGAGILTFGPPAVQLAGANADDFAITSDTCTATSLAPSASCTVDVTFTPTAEGTSTANLVFVSDAGTREDIVVLTGSTPRPPRMLPPDVLQQIGLPASGSCSDVNLPVLNWAGVSGDGWGLSWASWMNDGQGGAVCTRTLTYDGNVERWTIAR